jgi:hypothetical protein
MIAKWPWSSGPSPIRQQVLPLIETWTLAQLPYQPTLHGRCMRLMFAEGHELLAAADDKGQVSLFRLSYEGELLHTYSLNAPILDVGFSADGTVLGVLCSGDPVAYLHSTEHPQTNSLASVEGRLSNPFGFVPRVASGDIFALDSRESALSVVNLRTGREMARFDVDLQGVLAAASNQGVVLVGYHPATQQWTAAGHIGSWKSLDNMDPACSLAVTRDGTKLALGGYRPDAGISIHDRTGVVKLSSEDQEQLWYHDVAFVERDKVLVAVSRKLAEGTQAGGTVIRAWNLGTSEVIIHQVIEMTVTATAFDRKDGLVGLASGSELRVFRLKAEKVPAGD